MGVDKIGLTIDYSGRYILNESKTEANYRYLLVRPNNSNNKLDKIVTYQFPKDGTSKLNKGLYSINTKFVIGVLDSKLFNNVRYEIRVKDENDAYVMLRPELNRNYIVVRLNQGTKINDIYSTDANQLCYVNVPVDNAKIEIKLHTIDNANSDFTVYDPLDEDNTGIKYSKPYPPVERASDSYIVITDMDIQQLDIPGNMNFIVNYLVDDYLLKDRVTGGDHQLKEHQRKTPIEYLKEKIKNVVQKEYPGKTIKDIPTVISIQKRTSEYLPNSLPISLELNSSYDINNITFVGDPIFRYTVYNDLVDDYRLFFETRLRVATDNKIINENIIFTAQVSQKLLTVFFDDNSKYSSGKTQINGITLGQINSHPVISQNDYVNVAKLKYYIEHRSKSYPWKETSNKSIKSYLTMGMDRLATSKNAVYDSIKILEKISIDDIFSDSDVGAYRKKYINHLGNVFLQTFYHKSNSSQNEINSLMNQTITYSYNLQPAFIWASPGVNPDDDTPFGADKKEYSISNASKFLLHTGWTIDASADSPSKSLHYSPITKLWTGYDLDNGSLARISSTISSAAASLDENRIFEDYQGVPGLSTIKGIFNAMEYGIGSAKLSIADGSATIIGEDIYYSVKDNDGNYKLTPSQTTSGAKIQTKMDFYENDPLNPTENTLHLLDKEVYDQIRGLLLKGAAVVMPVRKIGVKYDPTKDFYASENAALVDTAYMVIGDGYVTMKYGQNNGGKGLAEPPSPGDFNSDYLFGSGATSIYGIPIHAIGNTYNSGSYNYSSTYYGGFNTNNNWSGNGGTSYGQSSYKTSNYSDYFVDTTVSETESTDSNKKYGNTNTSSSGTWYSTTSWMGDPVDVVKGEFYTEEIPDILVKGRGVPLALTKNYKSQLIYNGPFGYGWNWSHSDQIVYTQERIEDGGTPKYYLTYYDSNRKPMKLEYITQQGSDEFSSISEEEYPPGTTFRITNSTIDYKKHDGTIEPDVEVIMITHYDGSKLYFRHSGQLLYKYDATGKNYIKFNYANANHILRITSFEDAIGRTITLTYNDNDKVIKATDFTGRFVTYEYGTDEVDNPDSTKDDLIAFTDLEGKTKTWTYYEDQDNTLNNHNMKRYTLPNGDFLDLHYYKNDLVSHHVNKEGETFHFRYSKFNHYTESWNEKDYYRKAIYNDNWDVIRIEDETKAVVTRTFDEFHNVLTETDANNNTWVYRYDEYRNLVMKGLWKDDGTEATKIPLPTHYVTQYVYYPKDVANEKRNLLKQKISATGLITTYKYFNVNTTAVLPEDISDTPANVTAQDNLNAAFINERYQGTVDSNVPDGLLESSRTFTYLPAYTEIDTTSDNLGKFDQTKSFYTVDVMTDKIHDDVYRLNNSAEFPEADRAVLPTILKFPETILEYNAMTANYQWSTSVTLDEIKSLKTRVTYKYDTYGNQTEQKVYAFVRSDLFEPVSDDLEAVNKPNNLNTTMLDNVTDSSISYLAERTFTTQNNFDGLGLHIVASVDTNGQATRFMYDEVGRVITSTLPKSINPNLTDEQNAEATYATIQYKYNKLGQKTQVISPTGSITKFEYDINNRILKTVGPNGAEIKYEYGIARDIVTDGQIVKIINPLGHTINIEYDEIGRKIATTDSNGNTTKFEYDGLNRLTKSIDAAGKSVSNTYDDNGNLTHTIDRWGNITRVLYDELNRAKRVIAPKVVGRIDSTDQLLNTSVAADTIFNATGQVTQVKSGYLLAADDDYMNNNLLGLSGTSGQDNFSSSTSFDLLNRPVESISGNNINDDRIAKSYYDGLGRVIRQVDATNRSVEFFYDKSGNKVIERLVSPAPENTVIRYVKFEYDNLNRLVKTYDASDASNFDTNTPHASSIEYDILGRVIKTSTTAIVEEVPGVPVTYTYSKNVIYDVVGNIVNVETYAQAASGKKILTSKTTNQYNLLRQIVSTTNIQGHTIGFSYDQNGNLVESIDAVGNVTRTFYDSLNRVIGVENALGAMTNIEYDLPYIEGNNITANDGYHASAVIDALGNRTTTVYNTAGQVIKVIDAQGNESKTDYDQLGRPVKSQNAIGAISRIQYTKYGQIKSSTVTSNQFNKLFGSFETNPLTEQTITSSTEYDKLGSAIKTHRPKNLRR